MKSPSQMSKTATLVECALMVALAFVLSLFPYTLLWGGDITLFSTLPIVLASVRHGAKWGVGTAGVFSLLKLIQGIQFVVGVPVPTIWGMVGCALLDYVLAFTVLGFAGPISRRFKNPTAGLAAGVAVTGLGRYLCSVLSGLIIWNQWTWNNWPVWLHSIVYNASWCLPDVAIVLVAALALSRVKALALLERPERPKGAMA